MIQRLLEFVKDTVDGMESISHTEVVTYKERWIRRGTAYSLFLGVIITSWSIIKLAPEIMKTAANVTTMVPDIRELKKTLASDTDTLRYVKQKLDYRVDHMDSIVSNTKAISNLSAKVDSMYLINFRQRTDDMKEIKDLLRTGIANQRFGSLH